VPLLEARALYGSLRGALSGLSIPTFVVDLPGGAGKVPMYPDPVVDHDDDKVTLRSWQGRLVDYPAADDGSSATDLDTRAPAAGRRPLVGE